MTSMESDPETRNCQQRKNDNNLNRKSKTEKKKKIKPNHQTRVTFSHPNSSPPGLLCSSHTGVLVVASTRQAHAYFRGSALLSLLPERSPLSHDTHTAYSPCSFRSSSKLSPYPGQRLLSDFSLF